jgi:hypothetical protein
MLEELIRTKEDSFSTYINKKLPEIEKHVGSLIAEVEKFEPSVLHPRLKGVGSSFKSSFLELWTLNAKKFEEVERAIEKAALMKVKHFRLLFGVNPPELEPVNQSLGNIASVVNEVKEKRELSGITHLESIIERLDEMKKLIEEKNKLNVRIKNLSEEIYRIGDEEKQDFTEKDVLSELELKMGELERKIQEKEENVQKKVALARKPLKIYSHMTGKSTKDFDFEDDEIIRIASNTASEILKGNIKLKEKQVNKILSSLKSISSGEIKKEFEEIRRLKDEFFRVKDEITGIKVKMGRRKPDEVRKKTIEKELKSCHERLERTEKSIHEKKGNLERELTDVLGYRVGLRI